MSSTNKTANYQLSQFVGTDIPSILNDYNGDMRKIDTAIKEVANAEGSSASDIAGLQATVGQHTTEISGLSSTVNSLSGRVIGIEGKIPANASADNKLITTEDIPEIPSIEGLESDVADIKKVIPANASTSNMLATMSDVNTSELSNRVTQIEAVIPNDASVSNKLITVDDVVEPISLLHGSPISTEIFEASNYNNFGAMCKAVFDYITSLYHANSCNMSIVIKAIYNSREFLLYPIENVINGVQTRFSFAGCGLSLGSSNPIIDAYLSVHNNENSGNFRLRYLTFANSYFAEESPTITDGAVTGHELKFTATATSAHDMPSLIVYKLDNSVNE